MATVPASIHKLFMPYDWWFPSGFIRLDNFEVSSTGYYAYSPIEKKYAGAINEMCSTMEDDSTAILSYPVPFANLVCNHPYALKENLFFYDVTESKVIYETLDILVKGNESPEYVVFFYNNLSLSYNEKVFGPYPAHRALESYLLSQNTASNQSRYTLLRAIDYSTIGDVWQWTNGKILIYKRKNYVAKISD
ncbi:MAG: hypothetical protein KKD39_04070 [Candidatus Altiarchaeota archaeon]|nr:hypothetical protein [Candidatus Altiarchaeota archaeon]